MENTLQSSIVVEAVQSEQYVQVRRRVFRQLVESIVSEKIVEPEVEQRGDVTLFTLQGYDREQQRVAYQCYGRITLTFGRMRLSSPIVMRVAANGSVQEATSLAQFVLEVLGHIGPSEVKLRSFIQELEQTLLKDTLVQYERVKNVDTMQGKTYDELEGSITDGHFYHPSYKSRIGFDYVDHMTYGPEYKRSLRLLWLAVAREHTRLAIDEDWSLDRILAEELGESLVEQFHDVVRSHGRDPLHYIYLPVHPWQWREHTAMHYVQDLREQHIIVLGESEDTYLPQQSIRTLANESHKRKSYIKLPMQILNTSSARNLLPHFVATAAPISKWLKTLIDGDRYLTDEARIILLKEYAGISYNPPALSPIVNTVTFGSLGCIWRESIHRYLEPDEEAVPFNGLCSAELDGTLFIEPWLKKHGVEHWLRSLLDTCVLPIVHLLVAHGIAHESHGQNMVLVHRNGLPSRVALKDFHESMEWYKPYVNDPDACPNLVEIDPIFATAPLNEFFEPAHIDSVKSLTVDALLNINLGELALVLAERHHCTETEFWTLVVDVLDSHRNRYPALASRFEQFDLFEPTTGAEQLTKQRLYPDQEFIHEVLNPLYEARRLMERKATSAL
ncbi:IucA/IucC family protein [Paenibacillus sp. 481]|uniref:IucA/IucC family protein n=1 Tax=Paenibacillus sp. 481 TaxID=2835869 RepID=UPI001E4BB9D9|nr:IucA/IucC family protein [Paenibacillus sp. 481]UHA72684.1 siderophore biosynthesis protein [Paenibacillus sp. 481]